MASNTKIKEIFLLGVGGRGAGGYKTHVSYFSPLILKTNMLNSNSIRNVFLIGWNRSVQTHRFISYRECTFQNASVAYSRLFQAPRWWWKVVQ